MSALLALAQTVATTPLPTPTSEVVQAVVPHTSTFLDTLNNLASKVSQTDIIALGGALVISIQALLNKTRLFRSAVDHVQDVKRFLLAVALPFIMTVGTSFATGDNQLGLAPAVFLVGQVGYYAVKFLVGAAVSALSKPEGPTITVANLSGTTTSTTQF